MDYEPTEEQFLKDVSQHTMTVLLDQGVYRHISFSRCDSRVYKFDLITWPGYLCICGDMGEYVFARNRDMFVFFRNELINPGYYGEKLQAVDKRCGFEEHDPDSFRESIMDKVNTYIFESKYEKKSVIAEIENDVLCYIDDEYKVRDEAAMFSSTACPRFELEDIFDIRAKKYTYQYIWCLRAILWGIGNYDRAKEIKQ